MFKLHVYSQTGDIDHQIVIEGDSATIGRSSECNVVLDRMDISRRHARLLRGFVVDDLGSRNGTHVDGKRIDEARLVSARCFEVGDPAGQNLVTIEIIGADKQFEPSRESAEQPATIGSGFRPPASRPQPAADSGIASTGVFALRAEFEAVTEQYRSKCARLELELDELRRKFESLAQPARHAEPEAPRSQA